jgi:flagellar export protein FliJ
MGPFRFRLARVLEWRTNQRQLEQNQLAAAYAALHQVSQELEQLRIAQLQAERALLASSNISATDLQALMEYRRAGRAKEKHLDEEVRRCERDIWLHMENLKKAQIRVHVLEKFRDRRLAEHTYAVNRELEELAADAYLAKFAREL